MITLLHGDNSYAVQQALLVMRDAHKGEVEQVDGGSLTLAGMPDILMGGTLFSAKRLIVVRHLSENKSAWDILPDWLGRIDDDISLVLVEGKIDKRTKTYKLLQKIANVQEYAAWTERDVRKAEQWVSEEVKRRGVSLDNSAVRLLVQRSGVDQWRLHNDLEKLAALDVVNEEVIQDVIAPHPSESVFELFEAALSGSTTRIDVLLRTLRTTEEPYKVFALLAGQAFQLAAVAAATKPAAEVAKDIGAHPFAVSKLVDHARRRSLEQIEDIIVAFDESDELMKSSSIDPWLAIERALIRVAHS